MNWTASVYRAVAAATGRRFKSCRPDLFHVYVLRSERTGRRYVGSCEDLGEPLRLVSRHFNSSCSVLTINPRLSIRFR